MKITGNIVNIFDRSIRFGNLYVENGKVTKIELLGQENEGAAYILPGFIDAHVHIESSLLIPTEFARLAVVHGTVATVSDPHEIANVCGIEGVEFMVANGKKSPFKFHFGAPSCVPATNFETAGATIDALQVKDLLAKDDIFYLCEMMNYPGVLHNDEEVMKKIEFARQANKPIDGHAPGLMGEDAKKYIGAGITTDHECFTYEEALFKLQNGMKILIREGSAAKNFEALHPIISDDASKVMFCSDDKHPDSLLQGHINQLCARAVAKGHNVFDVLQIACINPHLHYGLKSGLLKVGDAADFIVVESLSEFGVLQTYLDGELVAENGESLLPHIEENIINNFCCEPKQASEIALLGNHAEVMAIEALDGQLITNKSKGKALLTNGFLCSNVQGDVLKLVVVNRYQNATPAIAFIKNIGLKKGAIAGTVAHDSHNIIACGTTDEEIASAVNLLIQSKGGLCAVDGQEKHLLELAVAGLMSNRDGYEIAAQYTQLDQFAKHQLGSTLASPYMTLSFMALVVIPHLKLSDKGLFDADSFEFLRN